MRWSANLTSHYIGLHLKYVWSHSWYSPITAILLPSRNYWSPADKRPPRTLIAPYKALYIYEARVFTIKLLIPHRRTNNTRPHCSISSYIQSTCVLQGFTCVSIIGTHTYDPSPPQSSWFLRVHQVGPCRRPDNGHYPITNELRNPVHNLDLPTHSFVSSTASLSEKSTFAYYPVWIPSCQRTRV